MAAIALVDGQDFNGLKREFLVKQTAFQSLDA